MNPALNMESSVTVFSSDGGCNHYREKLFDREAITLLPGHYVIASTGALIVTVLGSCIATCLRDPVAGVAGMNHFMLPRGEITATSAPARYGSHAMEVLINEMLKAGAQRCHLEAKIFGGARILSSISGASIGEKNAVFARRYLAAEGIRLISSDVLGFQGRKIYFMTEEGKIKVKRLPSTDQSLDAEHKYESTFTNNAAPGRVELFS